MFTKTVLVSIAAYAFAIIVAGFPTAALSHKFDPAPNDFKLSGVIALDQGVVITCDVSIDVSVDFRGNATIFSRSFFSASSGTSPLCGTVIQPFGAWTFTPNDSASVITTLGFSSILGQCYGTIIGNWSNFNATITFSSLDSIPGTPGSCRFVGTLTANQNVNIIP